MAGKIDGITLPKRGQWLRQGQKFATLQRDGQSVDMVTPVEGEVTNVNKALIVNTALSNTDPYGEGWFVACQLPNLVEWQSRAEVDGRSGQPATSAGSGAGRARPHLPLWWQWNSWPLLAPGR